MKLNRSLIKTQAKELIKGQVWALFLISFVVSLLTGSVSAISNIDDSYDDLKDSFNVHSYSYSPNDPSQYFNEQFDDQFDQFFEQAFPQQEKTNPIKKISILLAGIVGTILSVAQIFLLPLSVTLMGIYVMLVHGNKLKTSENFKYTFKYTFNSTYWNKLLCVVVQGLIILGMTILFIVPGIIFMYRYYFANIILADNPSISAKQAVKLSIKMTDGYKGELFTLDLSFIGWILLTPFTLGLVTIYTMPYYLTTKALYYENFKARAIANGVLTQEDFDKNTFDQPEPAQAPNANYNYNNVRTVQQIYVPQQPVQQIQFEAQVYQQPISQQVYQPVAQSVQPQQPNVAQMYAEPQPIHQTTKQPTVENPVLNVEEATSTSNNFGTGLDNNYYNTNV